MAHARFVLLGEVHDNPDAHALQGWAVGVLAKRTPQPAVVFEHITTSRQDLLDAFQARKSASEGRGTVDDLFDALDWAKSGWPPQALFAPLFRAVVDAKLPLYAASPSRDQVRAVARGDTGRLPDAESARIGLAAPMPLSLIEDLDRELKGSHCGMLPETAIPAMATAQRYRDAAFADVLLKAAGKYQRAILVAGNGHVRTDRGVPWYLRVRAPGQTIVSVMFLEVNEDLVQPQAYVPRDPEGKPAVDFALFTPRAERPDPCEALRQKEKKG